MAERQRILVVDDDRTLQGLLKMVLEKAGYQVAAAVDGMQGTMMARSFKPDLVILDIMMPAGGGFSVFERLRQMVGTMNLPVLVYSAMPLDQIQAKIPSGPETGILQKPAEPGAILQAVQKLLPGA
ncbi:MAG: response regulator [Elusimicrobiota bacterium]|jgi:CheY-like chemotaxis protein